MSVEDLALGFLGSKSRELYLLCSCSELIIEIVQGGTCSNL
jgi:hypothetical protein